MTEAVFFVCGLFLGFGLGLFVVALCVAAKRSEQKGRRV